jgi:hypothetical protein
MTAAASGRQRRGDDAAVAGGRGIESVQVRLAKTVADERADEAKRL